jgi:hypothetical protein
MTKRHGDKTLDFLLCHFFNPKNVCVNLSVEIYKEVSCMSMKDWSKRRTTIEKNNRMDQQNNFGKIFSSLQMTQKKHSGMISHTRSAHFFVSNNN